MTVKVKHHPGCRADYPEKVPGEKPQHLERMDIDSGEYVLTCVDCGAFVVLKR